MPEKSDKTIDLRIRMPNGQNLTWRFNKDDKIQVTFFINIILDVIQLLFLSIDGEYIIFSKYKLPKKSTG